MRLRLNVFFFKGKSLILYHHLWTKLHFVDTLPECIHIISSVFLWICFVASWSPSCYICCIIKSNRILQNFTKYFVVYGCPFTKKVSSNFTRKFVEDVPEYDHLGTLKFSKGPCPSVCLLSTTSKAVCKDLMSSTMLASLIFLQLCVPFIQFMTFFESP